MKYLLLIGLVFTSLSSQAYPIENRVKNLEKRIEALEKSSKVKLESCVMKFKDYGTYLNDCPTNTFAHKVFQLHDSATQLRCGYYQLKCYYKKPNGELEPSEFDIRTIGE